jgi:prefoldin subunit 5
VLPACQSQASRSEPKAADDARARLESELTGLAQELTRSSERSTAAIEGLRLRLDELDRSEQASRTSLASLERVIDELRADLHSESRRDQYSELKEEIRRLTETATQMASRIETLHEDLLKVQISLAEREKGSECCDRVRDLENRIHSLEDKQKKEPDSDSTWISNLLNGLGILVGVIVGTVISPLINRNVDRRKYTLQIWEAFVKMYPEIEAAQTLLRSPIGLNSTTLAKIQAVRAWMSAVATFSMESKVLDNALLRKLDLGTPMKNFVALMQGAIEKTEQYLAQHPTAPQQDRDDVAWVRDNLKAEWELTADIQRFYQTSS